MKINIMAVPLAGLAMVVVSNVYGQQEGGTLMRLWSQVEQSYPGVTARHHAVQAAELNERAVKGNALPQVRAQLQNTYGTYEGSAGAFFPQPGFFNVSGQPNTGPSHAGNSFASATIDWEVYSFGKLSTERQAANMLTSKRGDEKIAYLLRLKKELSDRYLSLLADHEKLTWNAKNVERLDDIRRITSGLSAAGLKPGADSLLAKSSLLQALGEQDRLQGKMHASKLRLAELGGTAETHGNQDSERFLRTLQQQADGEVGPNHPVLDVMEKEQSYLRLSGSAMKKSALPALRLLGGYAFRGTGVGPEGKTNGDWLHGFSNSTRNYLVGAGLTWNITSLATNKLKGDGLMEDAEKAKYLKIQLAQSMAADLSATEARISTQADQLKKIGESAQQALAAYEMYMARYKSGLITLTELLQIRLLLEQAEKSLIEAAREYWTLVSAKAELTNDFEPLFTHF